MKLSHTQVGLKCIFGDVQRIKINVDIGLGLLLLQGQRKLYFKFRSVSSMVIPAARTGKDNRSNTAVTRTDHTKSGVWYWVMAGGFMLIIVVIKLMAPRIETMLARCREKMVRSAEAPACSRFPAKGGYTVKLVPVPASTIDDVSSNRKEGGSSQKLMLFIRGKAISGAPIIRGTSQFPSPPIIMGMTIKKIITNAWALTSTL